MWNGSCANMSHYPGIFLEGLMKIMRNISQDSWLPGRDINLGLLNTRHECYPRDLVTKISQSWGTVEKTRLPISGFLE
jgi:hypothetical protein